jgi:hypothetical protein
MKAQGNALGLVGVEVGFIAALKGRNMKAQGNALGLVGVEAGFIAALKGRNMKAQGNALGLEVNVSMACAL